MSPLAHNDVSMSDKHIYYILLCPACWTMIKDGGFWKCSKQLSLKTKIVVCPVTDVFILTWLTNGNSQTCCDFSVFPLERGSFLRDGISWLFFLIFIDSRFSASLLNTLHSFTALTHIFPKLLIQTFSFLDAHWMPTSWEIAEVI